MTKLNPTGTALVYSTYLGGSGDDRGYGIAVDTAGNAYVTGYHCFDQLPDHGQRLSDDLRRRRQRMRFVTKLNPTGSALVYSTYLGGTGNDDGNGIAVDTAGNAYVTGYTGSTNFPTTANPFQTTIRRRQRCLRDEAEPDGLGPGLLHLPRRQRQ